MRKKIKILIFLFLIGSLLTPGCIDNDSNTVPATPTYPPKQNPPPVSLPPEASVRVSGQAGSWEVEVTNRGMNMTSYVVTVFYLDNNVVLSEESKDSPVIAPGGKGRIFFTGAGYGESSIMVKSMKITNGDNIEFSPTGQ